MKNNTLVGYITDNFDVIVDNFDIDHDCVGYDCKNHAYIIGSIINVQGHQVSDIIKAFKAGIKDMDHFRPVSDINIIMTGRHLLGYDGAKGYIYDKAPINISNLNYVEAFEDYGCVRITLYYKDESKAVYTYGLNDIDDIDDIKILKDAGIDLRILASDDDNDYRPLSDMPFDKMFCNKSCHATGYEKLIHGEWWNEYVDDEDNYYYGR